MGKTPYGENNKNVGNIGSYTNPGVFLTRSGLRDFLLSKSHLEVKGELTINKN